MIRRKVCIIEVQVDIGINTLILPFFMDTEFAGPILYNGKLRYLTVPEALQLMPSLT